MINVVTFASLLSSNLTSKILSKFTESSDDFFNRMTAKYKTEIDYIDSPEGTLYISTIETYADGTIKRPINKYDLLDKEDQEEVISLIRLSEEYKKDSKDIRKYLLPLAVVVQDINENHEIISYEVESYAKYFSMLPDFILDDIELLTRSNNRIDTITESDVQMIKEYIPKLDQAKLNELKEKHINTEINDVMNKYYALELLVNF